ncbi:MAG: hypothetical protein PUF80_05005 [Firmicutes bacterium]|nr:hypothetical protein [Bacillota bacterium]
MRVRALRRDAADLKSSDFREALNKSARAVSERFCRKLRLENRRNTLCISRFSNRKVAARDPLGAAADLFRASLESKAFVVTMYERREKREMLYGAAIKSALSTSPFAIPIFSVPFAKMDLKQRRYGFENRLK